MRKIETMLTCDWQAIGVLGILLGETLFVALALVTRAQLFIDLAVVNLVTFGLLGLFVIVIPVCILWEIQVLIGKVLGAPDR